MVQRPFQLPGVKSVSSRHFRNSLPGPHGNFSRLASFLAVAVLFSSYLDSIGVCSPLQQIPHCHIEFQNDFIIVRFPNTSTLEKTSSHVSRKAWLVFRWIFGAVRTYMWLLKTFGFVYSVV
ncbi:hypothetical protein QC760_009794 [Botrytis cinerea]